jgi:hypothetical protein
MDLYPISTSKKLMHIRHFWKLEDDEAVGEVIRRHYPNIRKTEIIELFWDRTVGNKVYYDIRNRREEDEKQKCQKEERMKGEPRSSSSDDRVF